MRWRPIIKQMEVREIIIARDNDEGAYSNVWLDVAAYKIEEFEYACHIYLSLIHKMITHYCKSTLSYKCVYKINYIS